MVNRMSAPWPSAGLNSVSIKKINPSRLGQRRIRESVVRQSDDLMQRLGVVLNEVPWPTVEIIDGGSIWLDTERVIQRGVHLGEGYRPVASLAAEAVGRTDDLSVIESTAGE